jgi:hypothetical protein
VVKANMRELTAEYGADSDSQTSNVDYNKPNCRELFSKEQHERRLRNTYNYIHNKLTLFISCIGFLLKTSLIFMEIKMKKFFLLTTSVLCVSAIPAQAQTGLLKGWSGEASLTGAVTTGICLIVSMFTVMPIISAMILALSKKAILSAQVQVIKLSRQSL